MSEMKKNKPKVRIKLPNGTIVEISSEENFCRLSDGDAGKVALYELHQKSKASAAAA